MTRGRLPAILGAVGLLFGGLLGLSLALGQQIHRNGFETLKMGWLKGGSDAAFEEKKHDISDQVGHDSRHSEYLQFDAKPCTFINYAYPTGKAVVGEELSASIWLKSNRPGMQLTARVVLPRERDPGNLQHLLTTTIRGDVYQQVGQWQQLHLARPVLLTRQQQQLLQAKHKRAFDFTDAYVDGLVLNVYGGPGPTEVWIDDVEVGPIAEPFLPVNRKNDPPQVKPVLPGVMPRPEFKGTVKPLGTKLQVGDRPLLFRGIVVTDTPLDKLRAARFNTVFLSDGANPALLREAADRGLWVVPMLRVFGADGRTPRSRDELARGLARFADAETLFLHLGNTLAMEQQPSFKHSADDVRQLDPGRVIAADVGDGLKQYAGELDLLGVHRFPLMTTLELPYYREWLKQRRELVQSAVFLWTSVQTHLPDDLAQALYDRGGAGSFDEPIGPQAEHIQLLTYTALAAGCRGLAYSSDRFLADSHQGRDRLLACALMNLELEMLEPLLAGADDGPEWAETKTLEVQAAVVRSAAGMLVLPIWQGPFSQFVPGQAAVHKLEIIVPPMPHGMQAFEVSAADVQHLRLERVAGGTKITLRDFGLTAAVVFTSDTKLIARFQEQAKERRQLAAQWSHDMAAYELDKVLRVQDQLEKQGHTLPDAAALLADAKRRLTSSRQLWENRAFPEAYREAQRSLRPLRILMRGQWEKAVRGKDTPVLTPYAASFYTLPRHWAMMAQIERATVGANVLPGGDFETAAQRPEDRWDLKQLPGGDLDLVAARVREVEEPEPKKKAGAADKDKDKGPAAKKAQAKKEGPEAKAMPPAAAKVEAGLRRAAPHEGQQCAMLRIKVPPKGTYPLALERTQLALISPEVRLPPGTLVRVSAWVCIPKYIGGSPDGALLYDSAGGEALALRLYGGTPWKKYTFYRRIPATGRVQVTLALTGLGTVYFDDVRIEPLLPPEAAPSSVGRVVPAH